MDLSRVASIAERVAADGESLETDQALDNIDEAVDNIIAAIKVLDENLPLVTAENVPQKAALDNIKETMEQGVKPYFADVVKDLSFFD
jgi:predicted RNase H-like HicB family nuclease